MEHKVKDLSDVPLHELLRCASVEQDSEMLMALVSEIIQRVEKPPETSSAPGKCALDTRRIISKC
jgi:hypothetical protein